VELVSLDGVMESPEEWAFSYSNAEMEEANASEMAASDAMLMARVTYEQMAAYWPTNGRHADGGLHKQRAQVRRLHDPARAPRVEQLDSDQGENFAEEIIELTQRPGEDITILRSGALVRSLLRGDLLDELRLMVHPVVLSTGKWLFEDGSDRKSLELVDSKTFGTGVLYLTYQPPQS